MIFSPVLASNRDDDRGCEKKCFKGVLCEVDETTKEILEFLKTSGCPTISFELGNGLPQSNPDAIPNSDGSYGTFVIASPGYYVLRNSPQMQITNTVAPNSFNWITIQSSDVYLDLCNNAINGSGNLTAPLSPQPSPPGGIQNDARLDSTVAIVVNPDFVALDNVTIANGKLQYFSDSGIVYLNTTNFTLRNLILENIGSVVEFPEVTFGESGENTTFDNVRFANNYGNDIYMTGINNVSITNCESTGCRGATFYNGAGNSFLADSDWVEFGVFAIPIQIEGGENIVIENVLINDVKSLADCFGIYVSPGEGVAIRNCVVSDVVATGSDVSRFGIFTYGFEVRGMAVESGSVGVSVEDCVVQNVGSQLQNFDVGFEYPVGNSVCGYNIHTDEGAVVRNCSATNVWSSGNVTAGIPSCCDTDFVGQINYLVSPMPAAGFFRELDTSLAPGFNVVFDGCTAANINGGLGVSNDNASPATGFEISNVNFPISPDAPQTDIAHLYRNCAAQDVFGSSDSAGFAIRNRVPWPANRPPYMAIYENCTAQFDRIHNPNGLSNGFFTDNSGNNVVFTGCVASGHTLNGFDLAGFTQSYGNWTAIAVAGELPQSTINVAGTAGFPSQGTLLINGSLVEYTGTTPTSFTGATGGTGTLFAGELVTASTDNNGFARMVLEDCTSNANSGYGFRFDPTINHLDVVGCNATNNGTDGINAGGQNMIFRNCIADLNGDQGISFDAYFPFQALVATNTDLTNLNIYGGYPNYTVQYFPQSAGGNPYAYLGYLQYFMLIPNDPTAPLPATLPINGVDVYPGDLVLVKSENDATLNGVYQANNRGGNGEGPASATPCWQLVRLNPWRAPFVEPAGTKVVVHLPSPIMYVLDNTTAVDYDPAIFTAADSIESDTSLIILDHSRAGLNVGNGIHNSAVGVVVRNNTCDLNGGIGFLDDSIGGAQANANLYILNEAFNNKGGNYSVDYVTVANPTILQTGSVSGATFPITTGQANVSITP